MMTLSKFFLEKKQGAIMSNRTTQDTKQDFGRSLVGLFKDFANNLQADAKRFNDEQRKIKERLENGTTSK